MKTKNPQNRNRLVAAHVPPEYFYPIMSPSLGAVGGRVPEHQELPSSHPSYGDEVLAPETTQGSLEPPFPRSYGEAVYGRNPNALMMGLAGAGQYLERNPQMMKALNLIDVMDIATGVGALPLGAMFGGGIKKVGRDPGFHSQARKIAEGMPQEIMGGKQAEGYFKKHGLKQSEAEWTGLNSLFQNPKVNRNELIQQIDTNTPRIQEHIIGAKGFDAKVARQQELIDRENAGIITPEEIEELDMVDAEVSTGYIEGPNETRYSEMAIPGGSNYREVRWGLEEPPKAYATVDREGNVIAEGLSEQQASDYIYANKGTRYYEQDHSQNPFTTSHWDEPNVLAHARIDDRVDAVGDNISFSNEYQSDWQAEGREKGFQSEVRRRELDKELADLRMSQAQPKEVGGTQHKADFERELQLTDEYNKLHDAVPNQPFKSTNDMIDFTLKRHIDLAMREGKDGIGWGMGDDITRSQNNFIRNNVSELQVMKHGDGYQISAYKHGGDGNLKLVHREPADPGHGWGGDGISQKDLGNWIGKDNAKQVFESDKDMITFTGKDMQIGGHGNKQYYDNMTVNRANKLLKRFGMKVERQNLITGTLGDPRSLGPYWKLKFTDKFKQEYLEKGLPIFSAGGLSVNALMDQEEDFKERFQNFIGGN